MNDYWSLVFIISLVFMLGVILGFCIREEHQEMNLDEVVKAAIIIWICYDIFCKMTD